MLQEAGLSHGVAKNTVERRIRRSRAGIDGRKINTPTCPHPCRTTCIRNLVL